MLDLHPACSGLPLASAILLVAAEAIALVPRYRLAGERLRTTAVVSALISIAGAFLSGYPASDRAGELHEAVEAAVMAHHSLGRLLLINSFVLGTFFFICRVATHGRGVMTALYYIAAVIHISLTVWVGHLGGKLVFEHGVNVASRFVGDASESR